MNKAVQQSSFYTNALENTVNAFSRNLRRIGKIDLPVTNKQYIYIYTELTPKLSAMASADQLVERWSRDPGFNFQPEALELHFLQLVPVGS